MKKITMLMAVVLLAFAMPGFAQKKKVAVVTFYADKNVDLSDVGLAGAEVIADLAKDPSFNLTPLVEQFHEKFFNEYATKFPFDLVSESEVTSRTDYQAYKPEYQRGYSEDVYVTYKDYTAIDASWGKKNTNDMAKMFEQYDGVMFVFLTFRMNKGFGVGGTATTKMQAYTNIVLYNKKGVKVFSIHEHANSKKTGVMVGGVPVMKAEKVLPMCESALTELMKDLDKRIQKIIDKTAKKL